MNIKKKIQDTNLYKSIQLFCTKTLVQKTTAQEYTQLIKDKHYQFNIKRFTDLIFNDNYNKDDNTFNFWQIKDYCCEINYNNKDITNNTMMLSDMISYKRALSKFKSNIDYILSNDVNIDIKGDIIVTPFFNIFFVNEGKNRAFFYPLFNKDFKFRINDSIKFYKLNDDFFDDKINTIKTSNTHLAMILNFCKKNKYE